MGEAAPLEPQREPGPQRRRASRLSEERCLWFKPLSLWYFVMGAQGTPSSEGLFNLYFLQGGEGWLLLFSC